MISALQLQHAEGREAAFLYLMRMQRSWPDLEEGVVVPSGFENWCFERIRGVDYFINGLNKPITIFEAVEGRAQMLQVVAQCYPNPSDYARINGDMNLGVK